MRPEIKSAPFLVKAVGARDGLQEGQFIGYASAFGNKDSYGDIVEPGAFTKTLAEWEASGSTIPVLWGHDMADPFANIGGVMAAEQDEKGLKVTAQLDLDNPKAAQVYKLVKGGRIDTMSFAYGVRDSESKDDAEHLLDLKLYEVSIVHVPANDAAQILAVKSAADALAAKAGRTISAKNESTIRAAVESLNSVLASLDTQDGKSATDGGRKNQDEKTSDTATAKAGASDEEPLGAKSSALAEESKSGSSSVARLAAELHIYALNGAQEGVQS